MRGKMQLELYIHIPFCVRKCGYCDFLSAPAPSQVQERYIRALLQEIKGRGPKTEDCEVVSVFFGGGTPSAVRAEWIAELMEEIRRSYTLSPEAEVTVECNPGTLDRHKLSCYRQAGVNRLSIGLQSADDGELARLGRIHTYGQFLESFRLAREAGFTNLNVDLMSALPGQSLTSYEETLRKVLALGPEHISAYSLIVEEGTPFASLAEQGRLDLPSEEEERRMYERTRELLGEKGYRRYEISNYALPGRECVHNRGYWIRRAYLGFGIGAASLWKEVRFRNTSDLETYIARPLECREEIQVLSTEEQMEEFLFLGLRLTEGIADGDFRRKFHKSLSEVYGGVIRRNIRDGLLSWEGERLRLTDRGVDVSNYVMAQFLF